MKTKQLIILVAVTAAIVAGAVFAVTTRDSAVERVSAEEIVFPGLMDVINTAETIEVTSAEGVVTVRHVDGAWGVAELADFPPRFSLVKQALLTLAEMKTVEAKTANPERHALLGLAEPGAEEGAGARFRLLDADGQEIVSLIVGKMARGVRDLFYIRRDGEDQTWLARGHLDFGKDPSSWVETLLLKMPLERVMRVSIAHADGETVTLSKASPEDPVFDLADMPEEALINDPPPFDGIARVVSVIRFDEVAPADRIADAGDPVTRARYQSFDGVAIELAVYEIEGAKWVRINALHEPDTAIAPPPEVPEVEELPPAGVVIRPEPVEEKSEEEIERIDVAAEVADMVAMTDRWVFKLPDFKVDHMASRMETLITFPSEEEDETPADEVPEFPMPDLPDSE